MEKKTKKIIERAFYNYKENISKIQTLTSPEEIACLMLRGTNYEKVLVSSSPKNTTEDILIRNIDEANRLTGWVKVVDYTIIKYTGEYKDKLIKALFFDKLPINCISRRLHIGRRTIFRWKDEILLSAETYAKSLRIV